MLSGEWSAGIRPRESLGGRSARLVGGPKGLAHKISGPRIQHREVQSELRDATLRPAIVGLVVVARPGCAGGDRPGFAHPQKAPGGPSC